MQFYRDYDKEYEALSARKLAHANEAHDIYLAELKMRADNVYHEEDFDKYEKEIATLEGSTGEHYFHYGLKDGYASRIYKAQRAAASIEDYNEREIAKRVVPRRLFDFEQDYLYYLRAVKYESERKARVDAATAARIVNYPNQNKAALTSPLPQYPL